MEEQIFKTLDEHSTEFLYEQRSFIYNELFGMSVFEFVESVFGCHVVCDLEERLMCCDDNDPYSLFCKMINESIYRREKS